MGARPIGRLLDQRHPMPGEFGGLRRSVAHAAKDQRVGQPGDAKPDAALGDGLTALRLQREIRNVDDIVEEAYRDAGQFGSRASSSAARFA